MKKILALTLAMVMLLSLAGCGNGPGSAGGTTTTTTATTLIPSDNGTTTSSTSAVSTTTGSKNTTIKSATTTSSTSVSTTTTTTTRKDPTYEKAVAKIKDRKYQEAFELLWGIKDSNKDAAKLLKNFAFMPKSSTCHDDEGDLIETCYYDKNGYLTKCDYDYGDGYDMYEEFQIDSDGNCAQRTYIEDGEVWYQKAYTYDDDGNCTSCLVASGKILYTYDNNGNLIKKTYNGRDSDIYTYKNGLLTEKLRGINWEDGYFIHRYTYDQNGNCIREEETKSDGSVWWTFLYNYDKNGNMTRKTCYSWNDNQNFEERFEYDKYNNLITYYPYIHRDDRDFKLSYTWELYYYPQGVPKWLQEFKADFTDRTSSFHIL